jgi:hypothetical protein
MNADGGGSESGSGNNPGGTSSNNNGGLGANTNSENEVITSLISCKTGNCIEADSVKTTCKELRDLALANGSTNLHQKLFDLRPHVNDLGETGVYMEHTGFTNAYSNFDRFSTPATGNFGVSLPYGDYVYGGGHSHPLGSVSIPSWGDLRWLKLCYDNAKDYNIHGCFNYCSCQS